MQASSEHLQRRKVSLIDKIGYGSGNLAFGVVFQIIGTYLVFYSTAILGIPGSIIGTVVSLSVIWDGVTDPMMGYISDHTKLRYFGRRHFYILFGTVAIAVNNYFMWDINPVWPVIWKTTAILLLTLLAKTFLTIYSVPYTALGAELSDDYDERSSIQGIRTIFFVLGLFSANVMGMFLFFKPTPEFPQGQLNPAAYRNVGITSSVIAIIFGLFCYFSTKKYIRHLPQSTNEDDTSKSGAGKLIKDVVLALSNKDYRSIVLGYLFTNIATALIGSIGLHVFTYTFRFHNNQIALIFGVLFGTSILSQPAWVKISKILDKKPAVIAALLSSLVGGLYFLVLVLFRESLNDNIVFFIPFSVLSGFGIGGLFSLPLSMIADTIDVEELHTGSRKEGIYYGCLTLCYKLSQSAAILVLGVFLDVIRFNPDLPSQPAGTALSLGLILAIGSIGSIVFAILFYTKYTLNKKKIDEIQNEIKKRQIPNI